MGRTTTLPIDKAAAARRQINAAIRLFFLEEDPLAVYTIAAAARRLVMDLASKSNSASRESLEHYMASEMASHLLKEQGHDFQT